MLTAPRADDGADAAPGPFEPVFSTIDFSNGALVAISGGGDSTALLLLLKNYLDRTAPRTPLLAVTVDHGLRAESAAEARTVAKLCADNAITHKTMRWDGEKPSTGLPAAAREARYRLLAQAASEAGIKPILTGHTADDQAETVLMRQIRAQNHGRGLAGMAPATLYGWKTWIVRPLLGIKREALRTFLRRENAGWIDDPTNQDETFERPRIRASLEAGEQAFTQAIALAAHEAELRQATSHHAATLIRIFASLPATGLVRLDPAFATADRSAAIMALRILTATIGGTAFPPDETRTTALFDKMAAGPFRATLSRTVIDMRRTGIFLHRERRDLPAPAPVADRTIWDGRRHIHFRGGPGALSIGPRIAAPEPIEAIAAPASLIRAANAAEPAFLYDAEVSAPTNFALPDVRISPVIPPYADFLPLFDLDLAEAIADLIGAPLPPAPPLHRFNGGNPSAKA